MSETVVEAKPGKSKAYEWTERIAAQRRSGMSVKRFCAEQRLTENSFYAWRKRLRERGAVRFAWWRGERGAKSARAKRHWN